MFPTQFSLEGKTILVTGASSGFGRSIAIVCAQAGANIILTARNEERLSQTLQMLPDNSKHQLISYDINDTNSIDEFVSKLPPLDGIVLCAGILRTIPVKFISSDDLAQLFQTNTIAPLLMIQRLHKRRLINRGCSIVLVSSIATKSAAFGNSLYAATKGALNAFSRVLALELAPIAARSNCILPGLVRTGISDRNVVTEEDLQKEESQYPLGAGTPEDIANAVLYLLAPASKWVTGTEMIVDGGATIK